LATGFEQVDMCVALNVKNSHSGSNIYTPMQDLGNKLKDAMGGDSHVIIELDWKDSMLNPDERCVAWIPICTLA
jgi:hypothetical protein